MLRWNVRCPSLELNWQLYKASCRILSLEQKRLSFLSTGGLLRVIVGGHGEMLEGYGLGFRVVEHVLDDAF